MSVPSYAIYEHERHNLMPSNGLYRLETRFSYDYYVHGVSDVGEDIFGYSDLYVYWYTKCSIDRMESLSYIIKQSLGNHGQVIDTGEWDENTKYYYASCFTWDEVLSLTRMIEENSIIGVECHKILPIDHTPIQLRTGREFYKADSDSINKFAKFRSQFSVVHLERLVPGLSSAMNVDGTFCIEKSKYVDIKNDNDQYNLEQEADRREQEAYESWQRALGDMNYDDAP